MVVETDSRRALCGGAPRSGVARRVLIVGSKLWDVESKEESVLAKGVRDLDVYKVAFEVQQQIFRLTKSFPKEEMYSLTDQIRRSSRSAGANLSEAWAKRRYPAHFVSKLSDSDGETEETVHWLETAFACGYIGEAERDQMVSKCRHIGGMLNKMMDSPESW